MCADIRTRLRPAAVALALLLAVTGHAPLAEPTPTRSIAPSPTRLDLRRGQADFDRDGFADLAVAATANVAGEVWVMYGSATGLETTRRQRWTQADLPHRFPGADPTLIGGSLAVGDFNADSFSDLVMTGHGLHVLYGSPTGLTTVGSTNPKVALDDTAPALAVGDFGKGPQDDIAVGQPYGPFDGIGTGVVDVLYGSASGLTAGSRQRWTQRTPGVRGVASENDEFGRAVAAGNFTGGPYDDLAIGVPGDARGGAVQILRGGAAGLTARADQIFTTRTPGLRAAASPTIFGTSLAAGHFAGRAAADLAIGDPYGYLDPDGGPMGTVTLLYGTPRGLTTRGSQVWSQRSPGVLGKAGEDDFARHLTVADFGRNSGRAVFDDLVVAAPDNSTGRVLWAGSVHVFYGSAGGLTAAGNQKWSQGRPGVPGRSEEGDNFGQAIAAADFGRAARGAGIADLAVSSVGEAPGGRVHIFYGTDQGLTAAGVQRLTPKKLGFVAPAETHLGSALSAGGG